MMRKLLLLTIVLLAGLTAVSGQEANPEVQRSEMKKVESLIGKWQGSGWIQQGPKRETFTGTENVQRKIDGLAILVEGKFSNPEGKVIHETLAVLAYSPKETKYKFRTYLASGMSGEHDLKLISDGYEWGFSIPGGMIRYTIKTANETWNEIGEFSKDGKTWIKFFEMNLKKESR